MAFLKLDLVEQLCFSKLESVAVLCYNEADQKTDFLDLLMFCFI